MTGPPSRGGTAADLRPYVELARRLVGVELSAPEYESAFFALFRHQDFTLPPDLDEAMQELFFAAEDFVEDADLREDGELDAEGLRRRVASIEPRFGALVDDLPG